MLEIKKRILKAQTGVTAKSIIMKTNLKVNKKQLCNLPKKHSRKFPKNLAKHEPGDRTFHKKIKIKLAK